MKPARIVFDAEGVPQAPDFGDRYHPRHGAATQAAQVFLAGNGLPARWAGWADFTILETGFGLGQNFLATWAAWRADPARPARLHYVAIDAHPPAPPDLDRGLQGTPWPALAKALRQAWPPLVAGLHAIDFDDGAVQLLLAWGEVGPTLRSLDLQVDAFFLDGFAPDRNPAMWHPALMQDLGRRAAPGATAATWTVARIVRDGLRSAGFHVERVAGSGDKRETLRARFAPGFAPRRPPPRGTPGPARALVLGAGLAGAWATHALARQGVAVTVLERHGAPAQEASGNPAGLFHGTAHADAGTHAGWNQAAALRAARTLAPWIEEGSVPGALRGLLRLAPPEQDLAALQALVARHEWPPEIVQALPAEAASDLAGTALDRPAWWFPQGGWVAPAALVERLLQRARRRFGVDVQAIRRESGEWLALDGRGQVIEAAPTLVLANGAEAARLWPHGDWPLGRSRGQLSWWLRAPTGAPPLQVPLAGAGYALALPDGRFLFGATAAPGDEDPALRPADHAFNLQRLTTLTGWDGTAASASLQGRVGWRVQTPDRLPIVGPVAAPAAAPPRPLQARWLAREPGLFALTALASRGLTWGPLAAEVLAAWVTGAPMPVPARLRDALDPARWALRAMRKA